MSDPIALPLRDRTRAIVAFAVIDADQAHLLEQTWHLTGGETSLRRIYARSSRGALLHHVVYGAKPLPGFVIDHVNGLPLDNRRANLRVLSMAENSQNVRRIAPAASRYRNVGIGRRGARLPWVARVGLNGVVHGLGYYEHELEAAAVAEAFRREHMPFSPREDIPDFEEWLERARTRTRLKVACIDCGRLIRPCNMAKHRRRYHIDGAEVAA